MLAACGTASDPQAAADHTAGDIRGLELSDNGGPVRPALADRAASGDTDDRLDRPGGRVPARRRGRHDPGDGRRGLGVRPDGRAAARPCHEHVDPSAAHGRGRRPERPRGNRLRLDLGRRFRPGPGASVRRDDRGARSDGRDANARRGPRDGRRDWVANHRSGTVSRIHPDRTRSLCRSRSAEKAAAGRKA